MKQIEAMGIAAKNRRKIKIGKRELVWYICEDSDSADMVLHVASQDKKLIVKYHLGQPSETRHLIVIGKEFPSLSDAGGTWIRVLCPEWEKDSIITPSAVRNMKVKLLPLILLFIVSTQFAVFAKTQLKAEGHIIAYRLMKPWETCAFVCSTSIFVVKVSKIIKGKESPAFIIVRFVGNRFMPDGNEYAISEFNREKVFRFNLEKSYSGALTMQELLYARNLDEHNNIVLGRSDLNFISGISEQDIPLNSPMPEYFISYN